MYFSLYLFTEVKLLKYASLLRRLDGLLINHKIYIEYHTVGLILALVSARAVSSSGR